MQNGAGHFERRRPFNVAMCLQKVRHVVKVERARLCERHDEVFNARDTGREEQVLFLRPDELHFLQRVQISRAVATVERGKFAACGLQQECVQRNDVSFCHVMVCRGVVEYFLV